MPHALAGAEEAASAKGGAEARCATAEYALSKGLKVIYCIGESLDERNAGKTIDVLKSQVAHPSTPQRQTPHLPSHPFPQFPQSDGAGVRAQ